MFWCPREDLNLHALAGTGPQPAAYASSATGARKRHYTRIRPACQFARKPAPVTDSADKRYLAAGQGIPDAGEMADALTQEGDVRCERHALPLALAGNALAQAFGPAAPARDASSCRRLAAPQAVWQIRLADEGAAEGYQVGIACS
jgi:hypothetical protein